MQKSVIHFLGDLYGFVKPTDKESENKIDAVLVKIQKPMQVLTGPSCEAKELLHHLHTVAQMVCGKQVFFEQKKPKVHLDARQAANCSQEQKQINQLLAQLMGYENTRGLKVFFNAGWFAKSMNDVE